MTEEAALDSSRHGPISYRSLALVVRKEGGWGGGGGCNLQALVYDILPQGESITKRVTGNGGCGGVGGGEGGGEKGGGEKGGRGTRGSDKVAD